MRVEKAFFCFGYTVTTPVDLNELWQFCLSGSMVEQWDKEDPDNNIHLDLELEQRRIAS